MTIEGSLKALCPRVGVSGDNAARNGLCRGLAEVDEQLRVTLRDSDVPDWAAWEWTVISGISLRNWLRADREWATAGRHQDGLAAADPGSGAIRSLSCTSGWLP